MTGFAWADARRAPSVSAPAPSATPPRKRRRLSEGVGFDMCGSITGRRGVPSLSREDSMARIGIDLNRRIGSVDRRIFGNFIEHLGRCIYGGIYEEGSPLSDAAGFRRDVLDAVRPLRVPGPRWAGGHFLSGC